MNTLKENSGFGKNTAYQVIYYFAFILYSSAYIISFTTLDNYHLTNSIQYLVILLLFTLLIIRFVSNDFSFPSFALAFCFLTIGFISWHVTNEKDLLIVFAFIVVSDQVPVKKLAKIVLTEEIIICILVISLSHFGLIENYSYIRNGTVGSTRVRYAMGFSHPNRFGSSMLAIACAYAVIHFKKFRKIDILLYVLLSMMTIIIADSRTSALMILLVMFFAAFLNKRRYILSTRAICIGMILIYLGIVILSLYEMCFFNSRNFFMRSLDKLLSGRFMLAHFYFEKNPIRLFGYNSSLLKHYITGFDNIMIDNAYAKLLILYGIFPGIIFLCIYLLIFLHSLKSNYISAAVFAAFIYACVGLTESQALHFAMNYSLIGCAFIFNKKFSIIKKKRY